VKVDDGNGAYYHPILREKKVKSKEPIDLLKLQKATSENITSILLGRNPSSFGRKDFQQEFRPTQKAL
jgi:hypothetical protein